MLVPFHFDTGIRDTQSASCIVVKLVLHLLLLGLQLRRRRRRTRRFGASELALCAESLSLDRLQLRVPVHREAEALDRSLPRRLTDVLLVAGGDLLAILVGDDLLLRAHCRHAFFVVRLFLVALQDFFQLLLCQLFFSQQKPLRLETQGLLHQLLLVGLHVGLLRLYALRRVALPRVPIVDVVPAELAHHAHLGGLAKVLLAVLEILLLDRSPCELLPPTTTTLSDAHPQGCIHVTHGVRFAAGCSRW
mmetsp:Transcript_113273/g.283731  ORF Transcript_113273/g.283731 Transcript_113273/m.283731 type:complete len:248 (+) Transcript_113273:298-1041(+)